MLESNVLKNAKISKQTLSTT